ncbi:hypothetical protein [Candidatus Oleimmundimicrobium sp.]|uniref:hypothetical protein n=1 Tax=Candidatus Oleimmundimicrobium sp. TaxID=3060597 RepID=UPI002721A147|nr:hypothetical protein [Candidatus Oleimmundimicrobium sp.]MDO8886187.1 hypothetical protein [Candidatus Oleimmundimicrobium sp.]
MSNYWLYSQLKDQSHLEVDNNYHDLISVRYNGKHYKIYSPSSAEYIITIDVVQKVGALGGNIISFPTSWCQSSREAILYGKKHDVTVIPHGVLFSMLDAKE